MSEWYHHHIPATHSIAYSVVCMQAKPVRFEAVNVTEIGDVSCCRRCG